jgi:hypothetical protein
MPTSPRRKSPRQPTSSPGFLDRVPSWVQAVVAVLTLLLSVLTAYGIAGRGGTPTASATMPSAPAGSQASALTPRVVLLNVREAPQVKGVGEFENLDLAVDAIILIGIPAQGSDQAAVALRGEPTAVATIGPGLTNGVWQAIRPTSATGLAWQAFIYPAAALGASGGLDDLKVHLANAEGVKAASEVVQPEP